MMRPVEALTVLEACIETSLGYENLDMGMQFASFREDLEHRTFAEGDAQLLMLAGAPPFFRSTTIRLLMASTKTTGGAQLSHVLANLNAVLPLLWNRVTSPDRWLVGTTYAELHAEGNKTAASGVRQALLKVNGFDYVPEDLRSRTYIELAREVLSVHNGFDNFYNEPKPMRALAALGTVVPVPALPAVMTATLSVGLGNPYGVSHRAQQYAERLLGGITKDRWRYYFTSVYPRTLRF